MQPIKQFQNKEGRIYASVVCEPRQKLLMDVWSDSVSNPTELADVVEHCLSAIKKHGIDSWLCDVNKLERLFEDSSDAAIIFIQSYLQDSGLRKFAFTTRKPSNASRQLLESTLTECGVEVKTFACNATAMQWLLVPALEDEAWDETPVLSF